MSRRVAVCLIASLCLFGAIRRACAQSGGPAWSAAALAELDTNQLVALYRGGAAAPVPDGWIRGTPLVRPGQAPSGWRARASRVVWQGKWFDPASGTARNRFGGVPFIGGRTSYGPSWLDSRPALILDYAGTSVLYGPYRDEIRQVSPGVYLGLMYDRRTQPPSLVRAFVLEQ